MLAKKCVMRKRCGESNEIVTIGGFKKRVLTGVRVCRILVELEGSGVFFIRD
jgi:hypothetical protein